MHKLTRNFFLATTVCFAAATLHVEALLPPFFQSLKEYKALLNTPELSAALGSADIIHDIQRDDKGFLITTSKHTLRVDVVYDPRGQDEPKGFVGPALFHLEFHAAEAIE